MLFRSGAVRAALASTSGTTSTRRVGAAPAKRPPAIKTHPTNPSMIIHRLRCMASSSAVLGYADRGRPTRSTAAPPAVPQRPDARSVRGARALHARRRALSRVRGQETWNKAAWLSFPSGRHSHAMTPPTTPRTATTPCCRVATGVVTADATVLSRIVGHVMDNVNYFYEGHQQVEQTLYDACA